MTSSGNTFETPIFFHADGPSSLSLLASQVLQYAPFVDTTELLNSTRRDATTLVDAAGTDWERAVRQCPEWNAADLVRHTGNILEWMGAIIASRQRVNRRSLEPAPEPLAELSAWYLSALDRLLSLLEAVDPETETWTFSSTGDQRVAWWIRRLAVEVAIHRWDAEHALTLDEGPIPRPLDKDVSIAGIEEFVVEFLPGLLSQDHVVGLSGILHLEPTDGGVPWSIELDAGGSITDNSTQVGTSLRATNSDLLLWLTNRRSAESLETSGDNKVLNAWPQLRR